MLLRYWKVFCILFFLFGGIFGFYFLKQYKIRQFFKNFVMPPITVSSFTVQSRPWQSYLTAVGSVSAVNGANISPEVSAVIKKILFKDGQIVKEGEPLVQLDNASEFAQLQQSQAQLGLMSVTYQRSQNLFASKTEPQSQLDADTSNYLQAKAAVESTQAALAKKLIRAPFSGKLGIKQVTVGEFVNVGQILVTLQSIDIVNMQFAIPQEYLRFLHVGQQVVASIDSWPGDVFKGRINAIEALIDSSTRTVNVQAAVQNQEGRLYPGMYATVQVLLPQSQEALVIPQTAVTYSLYGEMAYSLHLTGQKDEAHQDLAIAKKIFVKTGDKQGNWTVVLDGLKKGDLVVDAGQQKLTDGVVVTISNAVQLNHF